MTNQEKLWQIFKDAFPNVLPDETVETSKKRVIIYMSFEWLDTPYDETTTDHKRERDAKLLTGFIDVLSREMCLNKEIAAKLADDYLNIKSLTSKEYL